MKQPMRKLLLLLCLLTALLTCVSLAAAAATTCTETSYHKMPGYTEFTVTPDTLPAGSVVMLAGYQSGKMTYITRHTYTEGQDMRFMLPDTVNYDTVKVFPVENLAQVKMAGKAEELTTTNETPLVGEIIIEKANLKVASARMIDENIVFTYFETVESEKATKVDFAAPENVTLYINNSKVGTLAESDAVVEFESLAAGYYSQVTLWDTSPRDSLIDEIYLTRYEYGIVEYVDNEQEIIETDSSYYSLSADDTIDGFVYNIYKNGEKIELADLAEGDLLNVVIGDLSGDVAKATFIDIYVTNHVIESTVNSVSISALGTYEIDGAWYYLASGARVSSLRAGDTGRFYITIDGYIYDADITSTFSDNYAFVQGAAVLTNELGFTGPT